MKRTEEQKRQRQMERSQIEDQLRKLGKMTAEEAIKARLLRFNFRVFPDQKWEYFAKLGK